MVARHHFLSRSRESVKVFRVPTIENAEGGTGDFAPKHVSASANGSARSGIGVSLPFPGLFSEVNFHVSRESVNHFRVAHILSKPQEY